MKTALLHGLRCFEHACRHLPSLGRFRPAKGYFSAYELVKRGELEGFVLYGSQTPGPCPADSVTEQAGMRQHDHQPWPAFWTRADDARLVGSMLQWRDPRDLVCSEGLYHSHERRRLREDKAFAQILIPKPAILPGAWTSIASNWGDGRNYYHWITDNLTRLMVREHLPETTRILIPNQRYGFISETLEMLGLNELAETTGQPCVQPERFYFCSPAAMTGTNNPAGFDWLREKFSAFRRPLGDGVPIFLTRRGSTRTPENLHELEGLFASHGFRVIDCGKLSVKEQIDAASSAPAIAGIHGAAMTNILWAHPDTAVLELFQSSYLNACYEQIAFHCNLRYSYQLLDSESLAEVSQWIHDPSGRSRP